MRTRRLTLLLGLATTTIAFATPASELKASVEANFAKMTAAFRANDAKMYRQFADGYLAKNFVQVDTSGVKQDREKQIQLDLLHMAMLRHIQGMTISVRNVTVNGDAGHTIEEFNVTASAKVPKDSSGVAPGSRAGSVKIWSIQESTYRRINGKWMAVLSKTTGQKIWVDGKLMPF
jgi:hypothetical protein